MGMHHLSATALHQFFSDFTGEQRPILESDPITRSLLPRLEASREELAEACITEGKTVIIRRIKMKSAEADRVHDAECGMLWYMLQLELTRLKRAEAEPREIDEVQGIIDTLFPDGLTQIRKSYFQEASEAPLNYRALTRGQRKRLKRIVFGDESAHDVAVRWVAAAEKLGDLVRRRAVAEGMDGSIEAVADKNQARWTALRRLGLLMDAVEESDLTPAAKATLRSPVLSAMKEMEKRGADTSNVDDAETVEGADPGEIETVETAAVSAA